MILLNKVAILEGLVVAFLIEVVIVLLSFNHGGTLLAVFGLSLAFLLETTRYSKDVRDKKIAFIVWVNIFLAVAYFILG